MKNTNIDNFKTYEDYKGMYIVDDYIRSKYFDTVLFASKDGEKAMDFIEDNEGWDDCILFYIDNEGNATYPEF